MHANAQCTMHKVTGMRRREFLRTAVGAGMASPAVLRARVSGAQAGAGARPESVTDLPGLIAPAWCDRPMRWAQLTLVENDPGRFDPQFWLDYFARIHADAACLSAGGIVAYYPTAVPLHHRSAWLGDVRPVRHARRPGAGRLGMHVIARTDPHAVRDEVQRAHPGLDCRRRRTASRDAIGPTRSCGSRARSGRTTSSS